MTTQKVLQKVLEVAFARDAALTGLDPQHPPQAALYRIRELLKRGSLDGKIVPGDLDAEARLVEAVLAELQGIEPQDSVHVCGEGGDACYLHVFADGSLYNDNNAQGEVWRYAADFYTDRVAPDAELEEQDWARKLRALIWG